MGLFKKQLTLISMYSTQPHLKCHIDFNAQGIEMFSTKLYCKPNINFGLLSDPPQKKRMEISISPWSKRWENDVKLSIGWQRI